MKSIQLRLKAVKATIILALATGFLFSPRLWISKERFFPLIKPIDDILNITFPFDLILLSIFFGFSFLWLFCKKKEIGLVTIGLFVIVLLQDEMRWQPWVYLYLLMLLPYLFQSNTDENAKLILNCLQWIIAGVYVWSGIQKLNPNFLERTFTQMITVTGTGLELTDWKEVGYFIPVMELLMGISLLTPTFRRFGISSIIIMHVIILLYLSPVVLNHNSVVYPWNVTMIALVYLLFWFTDDNLLSFNIKFNEYKFSFFRVVLIILIWMLPILNFFGYWDHYLSFSLYSDKPPNFYIAIEESEIPKIDKRLIKYFVQIPGLKGGQLIDVDKWAFDDLNVPFYPESRSFKKLSDQFCKLGIQQDNLVFLEIRYSKGKPLYYKFACKE